MKIVWDQMSSGADINLGFALGSVNVGFMGIAPDITRISNNVGYKILTNVSGQEQGMMTNNENITCLGNFLLAVMNKWLSLFFSMSFFLGG